MKSLKYVVDENVKNFYRSICIAKYEVLADIRDSKLGIIWNIINPLVQICTYLFVFGMGIRGGQPVDGIDYFEWMIVGMMVWFFISPCITAGVNSIHIKAGIITKMKFPISTLPTMVVLKELFNHVFMLIIVYIVLLIRGMKPSVYNLQIIYYMFCAIMFSIALGMVTSVLNMITRDVKKMVSAAIRILMYLTPILWTMDKLPVSIQKIMMCNPIYYIVEGYRNSFFYHESITSNIGPTVIFWASVIFLFVWGSKLMYKFKNKFIDLI